MAAQIQLRRGTAAQWTAANPILVAGEPGLETDTQKLKIGDGTTAWASLPYYITQTTVYAPRNQSQTTTINQNSLTWSSASHDQINITLANTGATLVIAADSNTSPVNGQKVLFRLRDSNSPCNFTLTQTGTNRFRAVGTILPTVTTAGKLTYIGCVYNSADATWDVIAVGLET